MMTDNGQRRRNLAAALGKGLAAGAAGTAAMTAAQEIEMMLTRRQPSDAPARAVAKVLGIRAEGPEAEARLNQLVHWAYGTGWGTFRALLGVLGLKGRAASLLHLAAVWGGAAWMLPRLGLAPPVKEWGAGQIAKDCLLHGIYAAAAGAAYDDLETR